MSDYCVCGECGCKHLVWEKDCPYCRRIKELEQQLVELRTLAKAHDLNDYKTYIKWRGIEAGWDRELTPTELGDILAAAALKEG